MAAIPSFIGGKQSLRISVCMALALGLTIPVNAFTYAKLRVSANGATMWAPEVQLQLVDAGGTPTIDVDTATRYQTIDGFGGAFNELGWTAMSKYLSSEQIDGIMKELFDASGCNFNICRMPIGASDYAGQVFPTNATSTSGSAWYSLNETKNDTLMTKISIDHDTVCLIPYIKAALKYKPDLKIWASPWSPPSWMKTTNSYSGANGSTIIQTPTIFRAYALYLARAIKLFRAEGINLYALSFQNEPYSAATYPGCSWTGAQSRDFIKNYLGPVFGSEQLQCEIWSPTMNTGLVSEFKAFLDDPESAKYITTCCFQWEGKNAVTQVHADYPNLKIYETETECGTWAPTVNYWQYAENPTFHQMQYYFDNGANCYMQWNMVLETTGQSSWLWPQMAMISVDTARKTVKYNPQFYVAKHFSNYIRPGAQKIKTTSTSSKLQLAGFRNPDGTVVVVVDNVGTSALQATIKIGPQMTTASMPPKSFNTYVFSDNASVLPRPNKPGMSARHNDLIQVIKTGEAVVIMPKGRFFTIQLVSPAGQVRTSFSSTSGSPLMMQSGSMAPGIYVLKALIDGKSYQTHLLFQ